MNEEIKQLKIQVAELMEWKEAKGRQQISYPLDVASQNTIGAARGNGAGSTSLTQSISISGAPESINVPSAYIGTRFILLEDGARYEIPYISTS